VIGAHHRLYVQRPTSSQDDAFRRRLRLLLIAMLTSLCLLLIRVWYLQVIRSDYFLHLSETNRLRSLRTTSLRGKLFDRHGHVLAENRAAYTLMAIPEDLPPPEQLRPRLRALDLDPNVDIASWYTETTAFKPIPVQRDLPRDRVAYFAEHRMDFPGLFIEVEPVRSYPYHSLAAHVIGYLGEINESQLRRQAGQGYHAGDLIGQAGLERAYESVLRGEYGVRQVEVDAFGREMRVMAARAPKPGGNLVLSLDLHLQQLAEELLVDHAGSIAALDPRNGQILALASSPAFDPNHFAARLSQAQWTTLLTNPKHPLHNRAIQGQYPPGSIFKIITALAALAEGVITPHTTEFCPGFYVHGSRTYRDWKPGGHGRVDLRKALSQSCDVYFYHTGLELGIDRLAKYAHAFGLGQPTGFAPAIEKAGLMPSKRWKRRALGQPWYSGETLSAAIGQGYTLMTPLQAATMIAALANGGTLYTPYLVLRYENADGTLRRETTPTVLRTLPLKPSHIAAVRQGLWGAVNDPHGTGKKARHEQIAIAGKTGTAQVVRLPEHVDRRHHQEQLPERQRDHAWFVAFAPFEAPRIAVVIMIEHAGRGGGHFADYATKLIQAYLHRYPVAFESSAPTQKQALTP
jgi:penicillin-binding protein 2